MKVLTILTVLAFLVGCGQNPLEAIKALKSATESSEIQPEINMLSVSTAPDTPVRDVRVGTPDVVLAKFLLQSYDEPVKLKFLDVQITRRGGNEWWTLANVTEDISNIRLIDEKGRQLGRAITKVVSGTGDGQCDLSATKIVCHFGTSESNISYVIPENTARKLYVIANIERTANSINLQVSLPGNASNLEGQASRQFASSTSATGNVITIHHLSYFTALSKVIGPQHGRIRSAVDDVAEIEWGAPIGDVVIEEVTITFGGSALSSNTGFTVQFLKSDNAPFGGSVQQVCTPEPDTYCTVTFKPRFTIAAGSKVTTKIRVNSSGFFDKAMNADPLFIFTREQQPDILWRDPLLETWVFPLAKEPFRIVAVSYD